MELLANIIQSIWIRLETEIIKLLGKFGEIRSNAAEDASETEQQALQYCEQASYAHSFTRELFLS